VWLYHWAITSSLLLYYPSVEVFDKKTAKSVQATYSLFRLGAILVGSPLRTSYVHTVLLNGLCCDPG
jgi:hypothetical protein